VLSDSAKHKVSDQAKRDTSPLAKHSKDNEYAEGSNDIV